MEKSVVFPLYFLPSFNYVQLLSKYNSVYININEPFVKQSYRNRFEIMGSNKREILSIPLQKGKTLLKTKDVRISYDENWQKKHWQAIISAYKNAPFFEYYDYHLAPLFMVKETYLWEYNYQLLLKCLTLLHIDTKIIFIEDILPNTHQMIENINPLHYEQVFSDRLGFMQNLSIIDWLFNQGNVAHSVL